MNAAPAKRCCFCCLNLTLLTEEHPKCRRCSSTGRTCDGYSTLPFSRSDLEALSQSPSTVPSPVTDPAFQDLLEKRYFQFFRQRSVASNSRLIATRFWDRLVLQACHEEPAIKHAVLALSALHQLGQVQRHTDAAKQHELYAARQHQKALGAAQSLVAASCEEPHDLDRVLTACVIFILLESVRGDYKAAAVHMRSGRAISSQHAARLKHPNRRHDLVEIDLAMARLDLTSVFFQDVRALYSFSLEDFHQTRPDITPHTFDDIQSAQTCLIDLCRWLLITGEHMHRIDNNDLKTRAKFEAERKRCGFQLERFQDHFRAVIDQLDPTTETITLNLRCWYVFTMLAVKEGGHGAPETRWDAYLSEFETIVSLGEEIAARIKDSDPSNMFSYEIGYLPPVYFAASRCRDPATRRRAIAVLRDYPRQEGVVASVITAYVARTFMEREEDGLDVRCATDVPEGRRFFGMDIHVDIPNAEAVIRSVLQTCVEKESILVNWKQVPVSR